MAQRSSLNKMETRRNLGISVLKENNGPEGRGESHEVLWPGLET